MKLIVKTFSELLALKNHQEGEIIYVQELDQDYIYQDEQWMIYFKPEEKEMELEDIKGLDLYTLNKMILNKVSTYSEKDILQAKKNIKEFVNADDLSHAYMLLCHELRYYTVFLKDKAHYDEKMEDAVIECIENLGIIKSIDLTEDKLAIEIWFVHHETEEPFVAYLFNYDEGVILCH